MTASILCIAPHAIVPTDGRVLDLVREDLRDDPRVMEEAREWEEAGVIEARDAMNGALGGASTGIPRLPRLPRWICDLNRPWSGRAGEEQSLLGKPAVPLGVRGWLREGALDDIHALYAADLEEARHLAAQARGIVEPHSFGALGSTFDAAGRGRPVARPATAIIVGAPWRTAHPTGLARFIAPTLDATPWPLQVAVGDALDAAGLTPGLNPYGSLLPWGLSMRALAAEWFRYLAESGALPADTARRLEDLAWGDVFDPMLDADEPGLEGAAGLRDRLERWGTEGAELVQGFRATRPGWFILAVELREDIARAGGGADFGRALARGVAAFVEGKTGRAASR